MVWLYKESAKTSFSTEVKISDHLDALAKTFSAIFFQYFNKWHSDDYSFHKF